MSSAAKQIAKRKSTNDYISKTHVRLWLKILKTSRSIETELRDRLRTQYDTTLPRFDVMAALYRQKKGLKMSELSQVLRVSNGNVTGIVDRLVDDGLIVRVPVTSDRRAMIVRLTKKGQQQFIKLAKAHELWIDELLHNISMEESDQIINLLSNAVVTNKAQPVDGQ